MSSKTINMSSFSGWANVSEGTHSLTLMAKASGFKNSALSSPVSITKQPQPSTSQLSEDYLLTLKNAGVPFGYYDLDTGEIVESTITTLRFTKDSQYAIPAQAVNANIGTGITAYYDSTNHAVNIYSANDIKMFNCVHNYEGNELQKTLLGYYSYNNQTEEGTVVFALTSENGGGSDSKLYLTNLDTSNVTDMQGMFFYVIDTYNKITNIYGLENLDTSNVTTMREMFEACSNLTSLDLSNFDTSNVTDMSYMFGDCKGLTSLDLSNFDTSNVTDMQGMFSDCSSLTSLDLSNFDTSSVLKMNGMFGYCIGLTSLDLSGFNTSEVTSMNDMFNMCSYLTSLDLSSFDTTNVTEMGYMFGGCSGLSGTFGLNGTAIKIGSNFITSDVTNMSGMFYSCTSLTSLDLSGFNTSEVTSMNDMFNMCSYLTSLDLSSFDTTNVTEMGYMFGGCSSLTSIYVNVENSDWTNKSVLYSENMFNSCLQLPNYDASAVDIAKAKLSTAGGYFTLKTE